MTAPGHPFSLDGFFALRTPLLPSRELDEWSDGLRAAGADPGDFPAALDRDRRLLRERLRALVARPEIREALFVASPDLVDHLPRWVRDPEGDKGQRIERALVRYFSRMCHRPTPFGLFAGHSLGRLGDASVLAIAPRADYRRRSRLDLGYLSALALEAHKDPGLRATLVYRPNSSLYRSAGRLRFAESRIRDGRGNLDLVAVEDDGPLRATLARAEDGAGLPALAGALAADGLGAAEAMAYLHTLVDHQVLVPDLEPAITGPEPLPAMVQSLNGAPGTRFMGESLARAGRSLAELDRRGLGNPTDAYKALAARLEPLPAAVDRSRLWQVDLFKPAPGARIGPGVARELEEGAALLLRVAPRPDGDPFQAFRDAFEKRYGDQWVPLAEALDPEIGIGFTGQGGLEAEAEPLLEGLGPGRPGRPARAPGLRPREVHLLRRLAEARHRGEGILALTDGDLEALTDPRPLVLPPSFSMTVELAAASREALEAGAFQACLAGGGSSAARMLGRFCHGDPELEAAVMAHLRREEALSPDVIHAEIAHRGPGRMGNVVARPVLRSFEIPFTGRSGAARDRWIALPDLFLKVAEGRVVLWSGRLGREVAPRLSSAVNCFHRATDLFRFLCALQDQGVSAGTGWSWGGLEGEAWLPRVVRGRFVLARAQWRIPAGELNRVAEGKGIPERFLAVQRLRRDRRLPRCLVLADGDHELPVDLDNPLSVEAFWALVKTRDGVTLLEDFPGRGNQAVQGPEGGYCHQLVLTFLARAVPARPAAPPPAQVPRLRYGPGSEWLYAKLYCGQASADHLLRQAVAPLARAMLAEGEADRWHFLRYADPQPHLRIRFHGDPALLWGRALPRIQRALEPHLQQGRMWRLQVDTYEPETERYGGARALPIAERIFQADSGTALELLALHPGDAGLHARWRLAIATADAYFAAGGLSLERRCALSRAGRDRRFRDQGWEEGQAAALGARFRTVRQELEAMLSGGDGGDLAPGLAAIRERSALLGGLFAELRAEADVEALLPSFIHMALNRLLRSAQRAQELVICDFLTRIYASRLARVRSEAPALMDG